MEDEKKINEISSKVLVYLDYKWSLSIAQIVLNLPMKYRDVNSLKVSKTGLEVSHEDVTTTVNFLGLKLLPMACHGMQCSGQGELQMRIQAYKIDTGEKSLRRQRVLSGDYSESDLPNGRKCSSSGSETELDCVTTTEPVLYRVTVAPPVTTDVTTTIVCSQCGESVVKEKKFSRVFALPGDNWQDLADSWFCCSHVKPEDNARSKPLVPKPGDCHYSDSSLVLVHSMVDCTTSKSNSLHCSRCRNLLGELTPKESLKCNEDIVMLYRYQVLVQDDKMKSSGLSKQFWRSQFELGMSTMLLKHAQDQNSYRFLIEMKSDSGITPFLLIWLMDQNSVVYQGSIDLGHTQEEVITPKSVTKIIYKDCHKNKILSQQWSRDLGAESISLPQPLCVQLLQLLTDKTHALPASLQTADDFLVGHLENTLPCPL